MNTLIPHIQLSYGPSTLAFLPPLRCSTKPQNAISRRSANYKPSMWDYNFIQSLTTPSMESSDLKRVKTLKSKVRVMFSTTKDRLCLMELIDILQRIGISHHFEVEIDNILKEISNNLHEYDEDLYAASLQFRLLRRHGYFVSQDVFTKFQENSNKIKASHDTKGILSLYESSFLATKDESILEEANVFTRKHLKEYINEIQDDNEFYLRRLVIHALELPLHWRMQRLEARWFIETYNEQPEKYPFLLELAKMDFNIVQATHQEDLKQASRWWMKLGLDQKLNFTRDRLMVNFFWTVGTTYKPQLRYDRVMMTKVISYILILDDMYDIYATLDELEVFTNIIERWEINEIDNLPEYMRVIFLALFNDINEMGFKVLREHGLNVIPYLKKTWADLCKAYLLEAKWYNKRYTPTLEEYMENGFVSIATPLMCLHAYVFFTNHKSIHTLDWIVKYQGIVSSAGHILRFLDDLETSSDEIKRGDVPKSIQCYMHETGASEKIAREHIRHLTNETWKKLNEDRLMKYPFYSKEIDDYAVNLLRTAQCIYHRGDGVGTEDGDTKDNVLSLLIEPIII